MINQHAIRDGRLAAAAGAAGREPGAGKGRVQGPALRFRAGESGDQARTTWLRPLRLAR